MSQKSHKYGFKPRIELSTGIQPPTPQLTNAETASFVKFCTVKMEHLIEMTISKIHFLSVEGFWYRTLRSSTVTQSLFTQSLFCVCFEFFLFFFFCQSSTFAIFKHPIFKGILNTNSWLCFLFMTDAGKLLGGFKNNFCLFPVKVLFIFCTLLLQVIIT